MLWVSLLWPCESGWERGTRAHQGPPPQPSGREDFQLPLCFFVLSPPLPPAAGNVTAGQHFLLEIAQISPSVPKYPEELQLG